jgi:uroporphyrinogen-III synthase
MTRQGPLSGLRIVVTRERTQAKPWLDKLSELGAEALCLPMVEFAPHDPTALDAALDALPSYDWIAFTSANAVRFVAERCRERGRNPASMNAVSIAAVGNATARLLYQAGVTVTLTASESTGRGLANDLIEHGIVGQRVLLPSARTGRPELRELLAAAGATVDVVPVYATVVPAAPDPELVQALRNGTFDAVVLASPSAARHLRTVLGGVPPANVAVICIGITTAGAARELGYQVAAVAGEPSVGGLIEALLELFNPEEIPRSAR